MQKHCLSQVRWRDEAVKTDRNIELATGGRLRTGEIETYALDLWLLERFAQTGLPVVYFAPLTHQHPGGVSPGVRLRLTRAPDSTSSFFRV
jgi:hypothetical protein